MALNIATLKTRSLTAVVFVAVMLVGLLWNFWSFLILFTVVHFGCWYELVKLMKKIYGEKYMQYSLLGLFYITMPILMLIIVGMTISGNVQTELSGAHFAEPSWIGATFSTLIPCSIIFSIWINDTMAYLVGSMIGKTPFSKISPKKTWEGTIGGAILCIVTIGLLGYFIPFAKVIAVQHWIAIAAICAVFGTIGDLFESKLKRMANVKDSGSIMPGHGGFLDRFDSLLFAAPAVWVYVQLFM
jgi:phosphatidate cytidylyltransferase